MITLVSPRSSLKKFLSLSSNVAKLGLRLAAAALACRKDCRHTDANLRSNRSSCSADCMVEKICNYVETLSQRIHSYSKLMFAYESGQVSQPSLL